MSRLTFRIGLGGPINPSLPTFSKRQLRSYWKTYWALYSGVAQPLEIFGYCFRTLWFLAISRLALTALATFLQQLPRGDREENSCVIRFVGVKFWIKTKY